MLRGLLWFVSAVAVVGPELHAQQTLGFRVAPDVAVRIHNLTGATRITGWDRDSIAVSATVPRGAGRLYGGGGGSAAKVGVEQPGGATDGPGATLEIRVPRGARVWVKSMSALVEITDVNGEVEATSVTGGLTVTGSPRVATLETIDGQVAVTGAATVVRVRTGEGGVTLLGVRGDLSVTTIQGGIRIESKEVLSARLETVSGDIDVRAAIPVDGRVEIETHDGDVAIHLPREVDARFDLNSVKGGITTALEGNGDRRRGNAARFTIGKKAGAGRGASIAVRTFSGTVRVDAERQ